METSLNITSIRKQKVEIKEEFSNYETAFGKSVNSPVKAAGLIEEYMELSSLGVEVFGVLTMDTKGRLIGAHTLNIGATNLSIANVKGIAQVCLMDNASAAIIYHNHPSGETTPSKEDFKITRRIYKALMLLDVRLQDSLIFGEDDYKSLRKSHPDIFENPGIYE